jgi:hypothetical protein
LCFERDGVVDDHLRQVHLDSFDEGAEEGLLLDDGTLAEEDLEIIYIGPDDRSLKQIHLRLVDALHQITTFFL